MKIKDFLTFKIFFNSYFSMFKILPHLFLFFFFFFFGGGGGVSEILARYMNMYFFRKNCLQKA